MKLLSILACFVLGYILSAVVAFNLASANTPIASYFVWLDWDYNLPSEGVQYFTLYLGEWPNIYTAKQKLGYQNYIRVLVKNHNHIYAVVTATNAAGLESPKSNEVHIVTP